jgi:hypothetical protein
MTGVFLFTFRGSKIAILRDGEPPEKMLEPRLAAANVGFHELLVGLG